MSQTGIVVAVADETATVEIDGVHRRVPLTVVHAQGITVSPGDFVLVHTGLAVEVLSPDEAADRILFLRQGVVHGDS